MGRPSACVAGRALLRGALSVLVLLYLAGCVRTGTSTLQLPAPGTAGAQTHQVTPVARVTTVPALQSPTIAAPAMPVKTSVIPTPIHTTSRVGPGSLTDIRLALTPVIDGLDSPVLVTHAGDGTGRLFVVEKPGVIRIWGAGGLLPAPFLDIRDRVGSSGLEQGLLGLAFAPDYRASRRFFVNYTDRNGNTVVSRFHLTGDPNVADPTSEFKVLGIAKPAPNHNGGNLVFGPDGYLWIGTGDGGGEYDRFGNGQNPRTLLAKMLRLDVTSDPSRPYTVPPANPWVSAKWNGQDIPAEAWAVGLRNPWRYSFDRATGDLWIADVGQDKYEEIDWVPAGPGGRLQGGLNFGWSIMEGIHCFPDTATCQQDGLTLPIWEYQHGANGCSVTGGYVYRGNRYPALSGVYMYGDWCSGRIWGLSPAPGGGWQNRLLLESGLAISSFGEDQSGELYVVDLNGGVYQVAAS